VIGHVVRWSLFAILLTAVGSATFHFVRYRPRCVIEFPNQNAELVQVSDDGRRIAVLTWPHLTIEGWDELAQVPECEAHLKAFDGANGQQVHCAENVATARFVGKFNHTGLDAPIAFSPDRRYLGATRKGKLTLSDWQNGRQWVIEDSCIESGYLGCWFSPEGNWLVVNCQSQTLIVNVASGGVAARLKETLAGFTREDQLAVCICGKNTIEFREMPTMQVVGSLPLGEAFRDEPYAKTSSDGNWCVVSSGQYAELWDANAKEVKLRFRGHGELWTTFADDDSAVTAWSMADRMFVVNSINLRDVTERAPLAFPRLSTRKRDKFDVFESLPWKVVAPKGGLFALCQRNGERYRITVLDSVQNKVLWQTDKHSSLLFSTDGDVVVCLNPETNLLDRLDACTGDYRGAIGAGLAVHEPTYDDGKLLVTGGYHHEGAESVFWDFLGRFLPQHVPVIPYSLLVAEIATGREHFRVRMDAHSWWSLLSADGSTLAVAVSERNEQGEIQSPATAGLVLGRCIKRVRRDLSGPASALACSPGDESITQSVIETVRPILQRVKISPW
jgi:hypothetical protein